MLILIFSPVQIIMTHPLEILLKFEAEGREFAKKNEIMKYFVRKVKGRNNLW